MRTLASAFVVTAFALSMAACENQRVPTEVSQATSLEANASNQADRGGEGEGTLFYDAPFVLGFRVVDPATGTECRVALSDLDLNDFITQQPNGHWSVHVQGYEAQFQVTTASGDEYVGEGVFDSNGSFSEDPTQVTQPLSVALNFSVYATGTVQNEDGDKTQTVCQFQVNSQGLVKSDVKL